MRFFSLIALAGILTFSSFSFTKTACVANEEVMIGITNINASDLELVKKKFMFFSGITYKGYCEDQKIIALVVDRGIVSDNKIITDALLTVNPDFKLHYKEGTFDDLRNACQDGEKLFTK